MTVGRRIALALVFALATPACSIFLGDGENGDGDGGGDGSLVALEVSRGQLDPPFDPDVFEYRLVLGLAVADLEVTASAAGGAALQINQVAAQSGVGAPLDVDFGPNRIEVLVTAGGGERLYSIDASRGMAVSPDAPVEPPDVVPGIRFGASVAVGDDIIIIGSPLADGMAAKGGSVFVFERIDGAWKQTAMLSPAGADVDDLFGAAVAISGDTIVVGAPGEDSSSDTVRDESASSAGAAYVFVSDGDGGWTEQDYLKSPLAANNDFFGTSVAIDGDVIAVGTPGEDQGDNDAGAVYVFERVAAVWGAGKRVVAPARDPGDDFGRSVALDGDRLLVGAPGEAGDGTSQTDNSVAGAGAAYTFVRGLNWGFESYIKAEDVAAGGFGQAVSLSADTAAIGEPFRGDAAEGAVHVFVDGGAGAWLPQITLASENADAGAFGAAVALDGDVLAAGSESEVNGAAAGALYLFGRNDTDWLPLLYAPAAGDDDNFGASVGLFRDVIGVGAPATPVGMEVDVGAVHVFH